MDHGRPEPDDLVRLPLGKGCTLILTWSEYRRGIARGKSERRRAAMAQRLTTTPGGGTPRGNRSGSGDPDTSHT